MMQADEAIALMLDSVIEDVDDVDDSKTYTDSVNGITSDNGEGILKINNKDYTFKVMGGSVTFDNNTFSYKTGTTVVSM